MLDRQADLACAVCSTSFRAAAVLLWGRETFLLLWSRAASDPVILLTSALTVEVKQIRQQAVRGSSWLPEERGWIDLT